MLGGKNMKEEFVSRQQVNLLPERIRKAEETSATEELKSYIWDLFEENQFAPMNIMVVGAGGSYPAAIFAKHVLSEEMRTPNVEAVTPQTAVRILTQFDNVNNGQWNPKYDLVIGISYSGSTPDIKYVSEISHEKGFKFLLLTGAEKSTLSDMYHESDSIKIISYFNVEDTTGKERGMISMASTLNPAIIFDDNYPIKQISNNQEALVKAEQFVADLNVSDIAKTIKQYPIIHVFYEWDTFPTAVDIESKFTQSGIAVVALHEKKNFSHGRYTSLYNQNFSLAINLLRHSITINSYGSNSKKYYKDEYDANIADFLAKLCKEKSAHYIEIGTEAISLSQWNIEAMTKIPYLITAIGEELDIDISKPLKPLPKEAVPLYAYKGKF